MSLPADERRESANALARWLRYGGFAPSVRIVEEMGVTKRRPLHPNRKHCRLFLERLDGEWSIVWTGIHHDPLMRIWRLRKEF